MYLKKIYMENYGPIEKLDLEARFGKDGSPVPIVLMGKNGSGKTLVIAQILQALLNNKSKQYNDIPEKEKNQLYKILSTSYIKYDKIDAIASVDFDDNNFNYTEIMSKNPDMTIDNNTFSKFSSKLTNSSQFKENGLFDLLDNKLNYDENVCLYFPVDRYYIPSWKNKEVRTSFSSEERVLGKNLRNIICNTIQSNFEPYILNTVIDKELYDSKFFIKDKDDNFILDNKGNPLYIFKGKNSLILEFINSILSEFDNPNYKRKRLFVSKKENRKIGIIGIKNNNEEDELVDSFSKLSTGEYSLISMFSAILMDYDRTSEKDSFNFQDIKGIVLIDEAELNLHINLQLNVLPKLMKKFKNIQFILTTQSPFLIYGIKDVYGNDCDIYDMPNGNFVLDVSGLSEVKESYDAFVEHNKELSNAISKVKDEILSFNEDIVVVTEGKTDPIYLKKAIEKLEIEKYENIKIIGLNDTSEHKYSEEGCTGLDKLAEALSVCPPNFKLILLYDRDIKDKDLLKVEYEKYFENIYKMCLPVPSFRDASNDICIEHYFLDSEITREDGEGHRLFFGYEFNKNGVMIDGNLMCKGLDKCGSNSIKLLDGSKDKYKVFNKNDETMKNLALSKNAFANNILNDVNNFDDFGFDEFRKIFEIFDKIKNDN